MSYPTLRWDMKFQPSAHDNVQPVAQQPVGDAQVVTIYFNHTQEKIFFECEGAYGELIE